MEEKFRGREEEVEVEDRDVEENGPLLGSPWAASSLPAVTERATFSASRRVDDEKRRASRARLAALLLLRTRVDAIKQERE